MVASLCISVLVPSKASEMSSHLGEQVKAWEPPIALHLRIFFAPLIEVLDGLAGVGEINDRDLKEYWRVIYAQIAYWLPITLAGWLMLLYPLVNYLRKRIASKSIRRAAQSCALVIAIAGTAFVTHHLYRWATLYEGHYHMGTGGYFVMLSFAALCALMLHDLLADPIK
jgi:hypothetical protein